MLFFRYGTKSGHHEAKLNKVSLRCNILMDTSSMHNSLNHNLIGTTSKSRLYPKCHQPETSLCSRNSDWSYGILVPIEI